MNNSSDRPLSVNPAAVILLAVFGVAAIVLALYMFGIPGGAEGPDDLARNDPASPDHIPVVVLDNPAGDGFAPERVLIPAPVDSAEKRTSVSGTMFDPDGNPLPEQYVVFQKRDAAGADRDLESAVKSGADGRYAVRVEPGLYRVKAFTQTLQKGHDMWYRPEAIEVPDGAEFLHDIRFTRPLCTILGTVKLPDGTPLDEVLVGLGNLQARDLRRMRTAGDGAFMFEHVAPGTYRLQFEPGPNGWKLLYPWRESDAPERSSERWPLVRVGPEDREIVYDLVMARPVDLKGTAHADGFPRAGVDCNVYFTEIPGEGGNRRLGDRRFFSTGIKADHSIFRPRVYPGRYLARLIGTPMGAARPDPIEVFIDPALKEQKLHLAFAPAGACRILGRVADQNGRGIGGARIQVWDGAGGPPDRALHPVCARAQAVCDAEGRFTVTGLPPGRYWLRRQRLSLGPQGPALFDRREDIPVMVKNEGAEEPPVILPVLAYDLTAVQGNVVGMDSPLPLKVAVTARPTPEFEEFRSWGYVKADGTFRLTHFPQVDTPVQVEVLVEMGPDNDTVCTRQSFTLNPRGETTLVLER